MNYTIIPRGYPIGLQIYKYIIKIANKARYIFKSYLQFDIYS